MYVETRISSEPGLFQFCACVIENNEVLLYKYLYISVEIIMLIFYEILVYAWAHLGIV